MLINFHEVQNADANSAPVQSDTDISGSFGRFPARLDFVGGEPSSGTNGLRPRRAGALSALHSPGPEQRPAGLGFSSSPHDAASSCHPSPPRPRCLSPRHPRRDDRRGPRRGGGGGQGEASAGFGADGSFCGVID